MASTGCTPAQAWSEWDLPAMRAQMAYWRKHPPMHLLLAAYVGYEDKGAGSRSAEPSKDAVEALMAFAPPLPEHLRSSIPNPYTRH